jgi:hypothetical protein
MGADKPRHRDMVGWDAHLKLRRAETEKGVT